LAAFFLAFVLAAILGFAAHRASVCTVRAVAEVLSSRTAYALIGIGKTVLWTFAFTAIATFLLVPSANAQLAAWPLTGAAMLGGFAFGIGAAINGACAFSTLARLVDGDGGMLATAVGFALGVVGFAFLADFDLVRRPAPALVGSRIDWALPPALILVLWGVYEARRLWRTRPSGTSFHCLVLAPQYRLSSAAMLIGLASSAIFLAFGSPSYTVTVQELVEALQGMRSYPAAGRWVLLAAMLAGMLLSTLQRGTFRLECAPRWRWLRNVCGGLMMGFGVALTPGGNDSLVLYNIPNLSPHALPAFLAMLVGVFLGLSAMDLLFGIKMRISCRNDRLSSDAQQSTAIELRSS
jgi:uncharacterized protein